MSISASPGRLSCGSSLLAGGPLCIILGALCFSTTGTVQALAPDGSHPLGIGALRMQIGALALWAWCACRHSLPAGLRHWQLRWLIPATLGLLGFQVFFFWGVQQAGVAVGTVTAIGFSPVMAAILARIILGERPARIWYPATGLALAGLVLLNLGSSQDTSTAALLLPLLAGACYGAYFVFSKPLGGQRAPAAARPFLHAAALAAAPPGDGDGPVSGRRDRRPGLQPYPGRAAPHPHGHGRHAGPGGAAGRRLLGHLFAA